MNTPQSEKHQFRGMISRAWEAGSSAALPSDLRAGAAAHSVRSRLARRPVVPTAERTAQAAAQPGQDPERREEIATREARKRRVRGSARPRREAGPSAGTRRGGEGKECRCNTTQGSNGWRRSELGLWAGSEEGGAYPVPADTRRP